jgi:uncharacterized membrane-anchored protein
VVPTCQIRLATADISLPFLILKGNVHDAQEAIGKMVPDPKKKLRILRGKYIEAQVTEEEGG